MANEFHIFNGVINEGTNTLAQQGSTPSNPASSYWKIYPKSDGFYQLDSSGNESKFGTTAANTSPMDIRNYGLSFSVGASALTVTLTDAAGSTPSSSSPCSFTFRNATTATGTSSTVSVTSATTMTVTSGATLGHADGVAGYLFWYVINNAGTAELAVSSVYFDEGQIVSTTALSSSADSNAVMYSTTARTNVACRFIGMTVDTQTTAGTWAATPSRVSLPPVEIPPIVAMYETGAAQSNANNTVTRVDFGTKVLDNYNCTVTGSWVFTAPKAMFARVTVQLQYTNTTTADFQTQVGIVKNGSTYKYAEHMKAGSGNNRSNVSVNAIVSLAVGDTLWGAAFQVSGGSLSLSSNQVFNFICIEEVKAIR